jgi:hypothetical protein
MGSAVPRRIKPLSRQRSHLFTTFGIWQATFQAMMARGYLTLKKSEWINHREVAMLS